MTLEEAVSALAADPAALVWAGRDFDTLAATVKDHDGARLVRETRAAIAKTPDMAARLVALRDGVAAVAALLAAREKERASAEAYIAESKRAARQAEHARQKEMTGARGPIAPLSRHSRRFVRA